NKEDIDELTRNSTGFHVQTIEYEMLIKAFEPSEDGSSFMTTSEVINYLNIHTYVKYSEKRMGEALRKAGFKRESRRVNGTPTYGWAIGKVEPNPFHIL
ncbi:MAG: virulence protein, partial [Rikenellaceae bacterium]